MSVNAYSVNRTATKGQYDTIYWKYWICIYGVAKRIDVILWSILHAFKAFMSDKLISQLCWLIVWASRHCATLILVHKNKREGGKYARIEKRREQKSFDTVVRDVIRACLLLLDRLSTWISINPQSESVAN